MPQAANGYFAIAAEDRTNPSNISALKYIPVQSVNFPIEQEEIDFTEISGTRQNRKTFEGALMPNAEISTAFYPVGGMGVILRGVFGAVETEADEDNAGVYTHVFVDDPYLPTLTLERADAKGSGALLVQRLKGAKVESFSMSAAFGEVVTTDVSFQATDIPTSPTAQASPLFPTIDPFTFTGASLTIDGVQNNLVKTFDLEITNSLERQMTLRKARTANSIIEGALDVTFSATMEFANTDLYQKLLSGDTFSVVIDLESNSMITGSIPYSATITLPRVRVLTHDVPFEADGVVEADVEFSVLNDGSKMIEIALTNNDPAYSYEYD